MTSTDFYSEIQSLTPSDLIELFTLDTTALTSINGVLGTGTQYNWTPGDLGSSTPISYGGVVYAPMPIEFSGLETSGQGKPPAPTLRVTAIGGLVSGLTNLYGDLVGATVTRYRTMQKFLDGQPMADPTAAWGPDIFNIDQKYSQDKNTIEFRLAVSFDQSGRQFPARQVFRDSCTHTYRVWNPTEGNFIYGTCPYTGSQYYDVGGNTTSAPNDVCSKRLTSGCVKRFGITNALPSYAFPGVSLAGV